MAWVAVEPQRDRVHAIWCKLQLRGLANVHICAMGAAEALGHHGSALRPCSVDEIHLRFPYPPPLELSALTAATPPPSVFGSGSFLSDALRTLRVGGKLRMVTNEASWCLFMLAQVAADRDARRLLRPLPGFQEGFAHRKVRDARDAAANGDDHRHVDHGRDASASFFDVVTPGERWELAYEVQQGCATVKQA